MAEVVTEPSYLYTFDVALGDVEFGLVLTQLSCQGACKMCDAY